MTTGTPVSKVKATAIVLYAMGVLTIWFGFNCLVPFNKFLLTNSIQAQVTGIADRLENGGDSAMQSQYPEGFVFANAIFVLTLTELYANNIQIQDMDVMTEKSVRKLLSGEAKSPFNGQMSPQYGAFYCGWTGFAINNYLSSGFNIKPEFKDSLEVHLSSLRDELFEALGDSVRVLETYPGLNWPADNIVCMSFLPQDSIKRKWLSIMPVSVISGRNLICHDDVQPCEVRGFLSRSSSIFSLSRDFRPMQITRHSETILWLMFWASTSCVNSALKAHQIMIQGR